MFAIKIDVDTHDGLRDGVPRLLEALARHRLRATFFLAMGPDRMGRALLQLRHPRFIQKMLATDAPKLYGLRTTLSGFILPARPIAAAFPAIVRRIEAEGHEVAVHCWDHRAWQDELPSFKRERIRLHLARAAALYRDILGHEPAGIGAAAWMTTEASLAMQDEMPYRYASDLRWSPACRLLTADGERRLPQLPGSGYCLEELMVRGIRGEAALARGLLASLRRAQGPLAVLTLHAEVEGGPFAGVFDRVAAGLGACGENLTMHEAARRLHGSLPLRRWRMRAAPGRAFPVSSSVAV